MNGVPLPADAPSVASVLHATGYRTALFGKAHFEPFLDPALQFAENRMGVDGTFGPHRGFDHMETATHTAMGFTHYARMMMSEHAEFLQSWYRVLDGNFDVNAGGRRRHRCRAGVGERGAARPVPHRLGRAAHDRVPRLVARRRRLLRVGLVPRPAPPVGSAGLGKHRVDWRDLDLPDNYPRDATEREAILDAKPKQWRGYYDGTLRPTTKRPAGSSPPR